MEKMTSIPRSILFVLVSVIISYTSCDTKPKNELTTHCPCFERDLPVRGDWAEIPDWEVAEKGFVGIKDISFENYPRTDGSTSSNILSTMVACKLLGLRYRWTPPIVEEWILQHNPNDVPEPYKDEFFDKYVMTSQTHGAFMNLIDGNTDIILTHRTISPDEKAHANAAGVTLIETPIALDAFVFVVNKENPVKSLTVDQIQKIYTKKITNWSQVGGNKAEMKVFTRPRNSGSEEVFRTLVMDGLEPADFPEAQIGSMAWVFTEVINDENAICYSFNTYKDLQARKPCDEVPVIAINDICPIENTVENGTYPLLSKVHVAIRSNTDRNSMTYKLYEWLQSENARSTITACGFLPVMP